MRPRCTRASIGDPDAALLGASLAFAGAAVLGSVVAIRDQLPGEPLGVGIPLSVTGGLLAGWGAAVAAPWPMPAAAVTVAAMAWRREPSTRPDAVCAAIGLGCVVGTFIEPVTRRPRSWSPATRLAIGANLCASAALVGAGTWHWATAIGQAPYAGWSPRLWQQTGVPARRGSGRDP